MTLNILIKHVPTCVPVEMDSIVNRLKKSKNKEDCLKQAYVFIAKRFHGVRLTPLHLFSVLEYDLQRVWKSYRQHCHGLNYFLRVLLVKSGWFRNEDIVNRWTLVWYFSPHQYMQIKIGAKRVTVDMWGATRGMPLGQYAHGFR